MKLLVKDNLAEEKIIQVTMYLKPIFFENTEILSSVSLDKKNRKYHTDINPDRVLNGPLSGPGEELESPLRDEWNSFINDCIFLIEEVGLTIISRETSENSKKSSMF